MVCGSTERKSVCALVAVNGGKKPFSMFEGMDSGFDSRAKSDSQNEARRWSDALGLIMKCVALTREPPGREREASEFREHRI